MTLSIAFGLSSCIDEDMSKCGKDYKIKYNLVLHTQIHTLIDIDLNTSEERNIANRLKQELGTVFTDLPLTMICLSSSERTSTDTKLTS